MCFLTICAIYELSSEAPNKKNAPVWDGTHSIHSCSYHGRQVACQMPPDSVRVINAQCQRVKFHNQLMTKACNQLCISRQSDLSISHQSDLSKPISLTYSLTHPPTHSLTHSLVCVCLTQHQKGTIHQKESTMYSGRLLCDYYVPRHVGRNRTTGSAAFCSDVLGGMKVPGSWVLRADPH